MNKAYWSNDVFRYMPCPHRSDPTAGAALRNIERQERRDRQRKKRPAKRVQEVKITKDDKCG